MVLRRLGTISTLLGLKPRLVSHLWRVEMEMAR